MSPLKPSKPTITTAEVRAYLLPIQGKVITLNSMRKDLNILPGSQSFEAIRNIMFQLAEAKVVRASGKKDGEYKVITDILPIPVLSIERRHIPPFDLIFPRDRETKQEMDFADDIVIREGDLIVISGMSNYGKTALCLNFAGENVDKRPVLMGNEFTTIVEEKYVPTPRFLNRLEAMDWVKWLDDEKKDKVTLLPVWDDYAEHIVKNRINLIDWVNPPGGEYFMISYIEEGIKKALGGGVGIIVLQKNEGATAGRGGAMTKDFADCELLLDNFGKNEVLLTIGKVKESTKRVTGRTFAYTIGYGVQILNFREVKKCPQCHGRGYIKDEECVGCNGLKYFNVERPLSQGEAAVENDLPPIPDHPCGCGADEWCYTDNLKVQCGSCKKILKN